MDQCPDCNRYLSACTCEVHPSHHIAQTVSDLSEKTANLKALAGGLNIDLTVYPHTPQAEGLAQFVEAGLVQIQDALELLQVIYPMKKKKN